jgi:hypothetical protein
LPQTKIDGGDAGFHCDDTGFARGDAGAQWKHTKNDRVLQLMAFDARMFKKLTKLEKPT